MKAPKKKKLPSLRRRKKVLWELCKQITRKKYILPDGTWRCYTCGNIIEKPSNAHTGHCVPQAFGGILLRYDLRNLRVQDFRCNINYGGNSAIYIWKLMKEIGLSEVENMMKLLDRRKDRLDNEREFIEGKIIEYRTILLKL